MADLRSCSQQAEELNVHYLSFVSKIEHDKVLEWYEKLESRFGKSHIVVKAHLNRLRKWGKLSDDRLHEVQHFSDVISTSVNTFKHLGYTSDLQAANNLNMVVDKHPYSLCVKWKEYRRDKELKHTNLLDFEKWIEVQAEVHDDFGTWTSKQPFVLPDHKSKGKHPGSTVVFSAVTSPSVLHVSVKVASLLYLHV